MKTDKLINDCITRWNITYEMVCRASEQQTVVAAVIFAKKLSNLELTTTEYSLVEQTRETLKSFKIATEALSTDKYPTASALLPLQHVLLCQVSTPIPNAMPILRNDSKNRHRFEEALRQTERSNIHYIYSI